MSAPTPSTLLPSKEAARIAGFAPDYMSRLCRLKKIEATQVGRTWFIERGALETFLAHEEARKSKNALSLAKKREQEYQAATRKRSHTSPVRTVAEETTIPARTPAQPLEVWIDTEPSLAPRVHGHARAFASALLVVALSLPFSVPETRAHVLSASTHMIASVSASLLAQARAHTQLTLHEGGLAPLGVLAVLNDVPRSERGGRFVFSNTYGSTFSLKQLLAGMGGGLVRISDAILAVHERGVRVFVYESRRAPSRVIMSVYGVGVHTATFAHTAPRALLAHRWSVENTLLGIVGNVALAYDTARMSLRKAYEYVPVESFFAGAAASRDMVDDSNFHE